MQISLFDGNKKFRIDKPIRLIELFAGIGSQAKALKNLGVDFEHYRICEFDKYAVQGYNAVHGTNFETSDITKITANDLGIVNTDKYCYIMTYSFPCQDLSNAGLGKGMAKGSGTRSGLLWEVERLLDECEELPQVLVMENVPRVIGQGNVENFAKWVEKLEQLGYKNKWEILNAKDFGIPQNRERCFMVSVLGDYYYEFPKTIPLKKSVNDFLEKNVNHKYYLTLNQLIYAFDCKRVCDNTKRGDLGDRKVNPQIAKTISCRGAESQRADITNFVVGDNSIEYTLGEIRDVINLKRELCNKLVLSGVLKENCVINHSYTNGGNGKNPNSRQTFLDYIETINGTSPTLTTRPDVLGFVVKTKNKHLKNLIEKIDTSDTLALDTYNQSTHTKFVQTIRANINSRNEDFVWSNLRIRKFTPKECWRLMGFEDADIDKAIAIGMSNAQLYKQAGNSIVVSVLMAIFSQMI